MEAAAGGVGRKTDVHEGRVSMLAFRRNKLGLPNLLTRVDTRAVAANYPKAMEDEDLDIMTVFHSAWQLGPFVGSGSFGVVRRATPVATSRGTPGSCGGLSVAAKCFRFPDEEQREMAQQEYNMMRSLKHKSLVRAEAIYESAKQVIICMELCSDGCVQTYVDKHGGFQEEDAGRNLCRQIIEGLSYLHCKRIVHRDLKPSNLLLKDKAQTLKIGDFGCATKVGSEPFSKMLSGRGAPLFNPPEILFGLWWNERVDIWGCGISCYFMLKAKLPFSLESRETRASLRAGKLPHISWYGLSALMKILLEQCLAVEMKDRPPAMELLMHPALQKAVAVSDDKNCIEDGSRFVLNSTCGLLCLGGDKVGGDARGRTPPSVREQKKPSAKRRSTSLPGVSAVGAAFQNLAAEKCRRVLRNSRVPSPERKAGGEEGGGAACAHAIKSIKAIKATVAAGAAAARAADGAGGASAAGGGQSDAIPSPIVAAAGGGRGAPRRRACTESSTTRATRRQAEGVGGGSASAYTNNAIKA